MQLTNSSKKESNGHRWQLFGITPAEYFDRYLSDDKYLCNFYAYCISKHIYIIAFYILTRV